MWTNTLRKQQTKEFYNVIRTVEETFHVLKTDLDNRPVYHKSDNGIKSHLNLAILTYWVISVTKYRLKSKKHENVGWDEIMRIASTQVVVTAKVETVDGQVISIRQSTEAESKLSAIHDLLYINHKPLGKRNSMLHPNQTSKNPDIGNQGVTWCVTAMWVNTGYRCPVLSATRVSVSAMLVYIP